MSSGNDGDGGWRFAGWLAVGKGTHRAVNRTQELGRHYPYALQCDIRLFFPSIGHAILLDILAHNLTERDVLWLIDRILDSLPSGLA